MKQILITTLLLMPLLAFGQYPASPTTKVDLGRQTTGDGLTFRTSGVPSWTPTSRNNAWTALDTVANVLYLYDASAAEWLPVSSERTVYPIVKNTSGVTLAAGTVVAVDEANPATGDKLNVVAAEGDGTKPAKLIVGVLVQSLANNGEGRAAWFGVVKGLSLPTLQPAGETWAEGDILYLSGTINGGLTKTEPARPALDLPVAVITRISGNNLTLLVRPQLGEKLGELHDVSITGVTNGQVLTYNDTTGLWVARTPSSGGGGGVTDGDKGDITVSSGGTVWTIDNDAVTAAKIAAGAVGEAELATDAVTSAKIAADAVGSSEIASGAVGEAELATDAVTGAKIATGAVGTDELANSSVTSIKIGDNQVVESKITSGAVTETKIGTGAVTETKIGTDAVTSAKIAADAVGTSEIATDAVTAAEIAAGAVGESELATDAVTAAKIASGAVGSDEIATSAVGSDEIASSAVIEAKIGNDAVTAAKIATGAVGTTEIADSAVVSGKIPASNITTDKLTTGAVTEAKIATNAVTADKIATGAVGADELASTAVTPGAYTAANITVDADGRITAAANGSGGGGGTPAGSTGQIQYNNAGAFGASANLFWDITDSELGVGTATPAARIHAVGAGTTSATDALLLEASDNIDLFEIRNDGVALFGRSRASGVTQNSAMLGVGSTVDTAVNFVLTPKGAGALIFGNPPDGTTVGGNARGVGAVDLQNYRRQATGFQTRVASGTMSVITGGVSNTASGIESVVSGGRQNVASGLQSVVAGGIDNTASGSQSFAVGLQNTASSQYAFAGGGGCTASGTGSFAFGLSATATATGAVSFGGATTNSAFYGFASGQRGNASLSGQRVHANDRFALNGDWQTSDLRIARSVTGTGQFELFLNVGATERMIIPITSGTATKVWNARIQCIGTVSDAGNGTVTTGETIAQSFDCAIRRTGTTTVLVGSVLAGLDVKNTNMSTAAFTVDADDTNEALRVRFTAPTASGSTTVIRTGCTVYLTEIGF